ncbi:MAG: hypothetical protein ABI779_21085 [Acidobacteriota bacterium]
MTFQTTAIPIVTGNPEHKPAAFTRFVLPFAWKRALLQTELDGDAPHFVEDAFDARRLAARSRYFSPETSLVLFSRARWLRVKNWPDDGRYRSICVDDRPLGLRIAPPRAVLFEEADPDTPEELSTGFLLIDVSFTTEATLDDLLAVNELFRYWREPFEGHRERLRSSPGGSFSHNELALLLDGSSGAPYFGGWQSILGLPVNDEKGPWQFVDSGQRDEAQAWIDDPTVPAAGWICYTDDRAFVYSCALTPRGSTDLGRDGDAPQESGEWVRLVNVDFPETAAATPFEHKWAADRTYDRWKHYGTLYGFSSHSAVMIGAPCQEPPTWRHFADMYFDQVLLLLYLRVTTFRFSGKLSRISSKLASGRRDAEAARQPFAALRQAFAFFTNLYRFPLLSSQQQGIEMYAAAREALDVDELFEEVQKEIESTHEFFELTAAAEQQSAANWLGWIATIAASAGIALTFLGLDIGQETADLLQRSIGGWWPTEWRPDARWWLAGGGTIALTGLSRSLWKWRTNRSRLLD